MPKLTSNKAGEPESHPWPDDAKAKAEATRKEVAGAAEPGEEAVAGGTEGTVAAAAVVPQYAPLTSFGHGHCPCHKLDPSKRIT